MTLGLRTKKAEERYQKYLKIREKNCPLCERKGLKYFKYWKIIENHFPYDRIARKHNMIVPIRHSIEMKLEQKEISELIEIKNSFLRNSDYNFIIEANYYRKSLPDHFHLHLVKLK